LGLKPLLFLFGNMIKPREMPRPLALTGTTVLTQHTQKHDIK